MSTTSDIRNLIALSTVPGVGLLTLRNLVAYFGSASDALFASPQDFEAAGVNPNTGSCANIRAVAAAINTERDAALRFADAQIDKAERFGVKILLSSDSQYPQRLLQCPDAPPFLFCKGDVNFSTAKVLSVVGTRRPSDDGRILTECLVSDLCLRHPDIIIVSGLAFGVDIAAHRAALKSGRHTIAVVAHGLDTIYPAQHRDTASQIARQGCVLSEFTFGSKPETYNFVARNRIIAGLADATLIVESGIKGGSLITVRNAFDYNRQVLAVPGFPGREQSLGCNDVIKRNMASLVESADDIDRVMAWELPAAARRSGSRAAGASGSSANMAAIQPTLFPEPKTDDERAIVSALRVEDGLSAAVISQRTQLPVAKVNVALLNMEFAGIVKALPGNNYRLMI